MSNSNTRTGSATGAQSLPGYITLILIAAAALLMVASGVLAAGPIVGDGETDSPNLRVVDLTNDHGLRAPTDRDEGCSLQYYYDDTCTYGYAWPLPQDSSDWFAVRFTQDEVSACTLSTVRVKLYRPFMTGTPDLQIGIYNDDGFGLPGTLLATEAVPNDSLPPEDFGWAEVDFAPMVFNLGEVFHIGITTIGGEGDTLFALSDAGTGPHAGEDRSETHNQIDGLWYTLNDLYGYDFVFMFEAEMCCADIECVPPPSGMVDWWHLDETSGPLANDIAGSVNNSGTWMNSPVPVTGKVDGALSFNGSNSVDVPDDPELNFGTGDFSVDLWIKTTSASGASPIVDKRTGSVPNITGYILYLYNGYLGSQIGDGSGYLSWTSTGFVADGNWHHIAVTVDRDNPSGWLYYVDGGAIGTPANPTAYQGSLTNTAPLVMARNLVTPSHTFAGTLDEIGLFNRVLDPSEIYSIWAADSAGKCKDFPITYASIEDIHDSAFVWDDGRSLEVVGDYTINEEGQLVSDINDYLCNVPMPAKSVLFLNGDTLSEDCFGGQVSLQGHIDSIGTNPHPYRPEEDTLLVYFDVQGYELLSEGDPGFAAPRKPSEYDDIDPLRGGNQKGVCKFAVLLVGGIDQNNIHVRYRNIVELYFEKLTVHMGYAPGDVYVLYYDGKPSHLPTIPATSIYDASINSLSAAFGAFTTDIGNCHNAGDKTSLFMMTFGPGEASGHINLLGQNTLIPDLLAAYIQSLHNIGCEDVYLAMGQGHGGIPALYLKDENETCINTFFPTKFRVTSSAHVLTRAISTATGDKYLEGLIAELAVGSVFEVATVKGCLEYYDWLKLKPTPTPDEQDAIDWGPIVWQRNRMYLHDLISVVGFASGKFEFRFDQEEMEGHTCANVSLWEKMAMGWPNVAHWNYNIPGIEDNYPPPTYVPGNELRTWGIGPTSTGIFRVVSESWKAFTLITSSHMYCTQSWKGGGDHDCTSSPSNHDLFAGFNLGWIDSSAAEFGEIVAPFHAISGPNLVGFNLSEMPQRLGPTGVTTLEVTFPIPEYNVFWTDMELVLDVVDVTAPGDLIITFPGSGKQDTTLYIAEAGVYTVPLGAIPDDSLHTITFDASGTDFAVDAWGVVSIYSASCCVLRGDIDHNGAGPDIADLVFLVNYMFNGGPVPPCIEEADVNGDGAGPDIADLVYLVNYMFNGGPAPIPCGQSAPKLSAVVPEVSIELDYDGAFTTISTNSEARLLGLQLELETAADSPQLLLDDGFELYSYRHESQLRIGCLDIDGVLAFPTGRTEILRLPGKARVIEATVTDHSFTPIHPEIIVGKSETLPYRFELGQNYPNPFNPVTRIDFSLPQATSTKLEIFNIVGQSVTILVDDVLEAGHHQATWDASDQASGVYFYRITSEHQTHSKKMLLLK